MNLLLSGGFFAEVANGFYVSLVVDQRWLQYLKALGFTLMISAGALLIGVLLGLILAMIKYIAGFHRGFRIPAAICDVYIAIIRGTPVMLQLLIMYFAILVFIESSALVAIITFGLNSAAYVAEAARGGLQAVDSGQLEAGRSLGLSLPRTMGSIILPQAVRKMIPPLGNEFIALIKETSVAGVIAVLELTEIAKIIRSATSEAFIPLMISAVIYLILVLLLTWGLRKIERRLARSDRT